MAILSEAPAANAVERNSRRGYRQRGSEKFAEVWRKSADQAKRELNDNGADIATRDDWGLPNYDSREFISRAGRDEWFARCRPQNVPLQRYYAVSLKWNGRGSVGIRHNKIC